MAFKLTRVTKEVCCLSNGSRICALIKTKEAQQSSMANFIMCECV